LSRRRFWKGEYNTDKIAAFQTLLECLKTVSILSSPISPFFMDNLFQDLTMNNESVHLTDFPNYSESLINKELQTKIRKSQEICSLALSLRKKEKIKVRQPLNKIIIPYRNDMEKEGLIDISEFIKSEINVKNVELVGDSSKILVKKAKPNFKLLGPKFGKDLKIVSSIINNLKSAEIEKIENEKALVLENNIEILLEDIEIYFEDIEGWQVVSENGTTIALDTNINEELKNEGIAREIVNRIQNFRKDSGFNVSDKIIIEIENNNLIEKAIFENIDYIKNETLAVDLNFKQTLINAQEFEFDNLNIKIKIFKKT
jgi:isoleucyl-tRNA synthetase